MSYREQSIYPSTKSSKGVVLLFLLWAILTLGIIAVGLSYRALREFKMVSLTQDRAQAYFLTWTALENIVEILKKDGQKVDSLNDEWAKGEIKGETEKGRWKVDIFYDEERRVDLNKAEDDVLERIFGTMPLLLDSLRDWKDADATPRPLGAEDDYYIKKEGDYESRDALLRNIFELGMMRGGEDLFETSFLFEDKIPQRFAFNFWEDLAFAHGGSHFIPPPWVPGEPLPKPIPISPGPPDEPPQGPPYEPPLPNPRGGGYTVYGDGKNNINTALPEVLMAIGLQRDTVIRIIWYRIYGNVFPSANPEVIIYGLVQAGCLKPAEPLYNFITRNIREIAGKGRIKVNSSYFRIRIISETKRGARHVAVAVLKRGKDQENKPTVEIVSWWEYSWL
ncbi:MAG: general secretion pathway protein GspK [Candidatus Omnitrophica bacterium]|nr:general secretion pathway protein GspK [Candidatus Omnitrophota bacterium]MCM8798345.1 general secretion pathway protein GspK [Candidatus Omnitrophota bacterium]